MTDRLNAKGLGRRSRRTAIATVLVVGLAAAGCGTRLPDSAFDASVSGTQAGAATPGLSTGAGAVGASAGTTGTSRSAAGTSSGPVASGSGGVIGSTATRSGTATLGGSGSAGGSGSGAAGGGGQATSGGTAGSLGYGTLLGGGCRPATLSTVNVGNVGTYSGLLGAIFVGAQGALKIWAAAANQCGGLNGHRINVISADDQGDPSNALTLTQQMVNQDHVIAFVGDIVPLSLGGIPQYLKQVGVPAIGGDLCENSWYTNTMLFPQGSSCAYDTGYAGGLFAAKHYGNVALYYCSDAPVQCGLWGQGAKAGIQQGGGHLVAQGQPTLTAPSYTSQCVQARSAKANVVMVGLDQGGLNRFVASCGQEAGYHPAYVALGFAIIASEALSNSALNGLTIPTNTFPWVDTTLPAARAYQAAVRTYYPNFPNNGGEATTGWLSGILAQQAAQYLSPNNPTSAQFLQGLYTIKGDTLGGATAPLTFTKGQNPQVSHCYFITAISNGRFTEPQGSKMTCF